MPWRMIIVQANAAVRVTIDAFSYREKLRESEMRGIETTSEPRHLIKLQRLNQ